MSMLNLKIKNFLEYSEKNEGRSFNDFRVKQNEQNQMIKDMEDFAKEENTFLGRIIKFQHADSYAYYIVTKVNLKSVTVAWVKMGDEWIDDRIGEGGNLNMAYVKDYFKRMDAIDKVFPSRY